MLGKKIVFLGIFLLLVVVVPGALLAQGKTGIRPEELVGKWELVVEAEGMVINLVMQLALENGTLSGRMSDQYGTFSDAPLTELKLENDKLSFILTVASPPDGLIRPWTFELKFNGEEAEGAVYSSELGITVPVRGKKTG